MVAHFYSEATLCVSHTFSSYGNGRLFGRNGIQSWWAWGRLSHTTWRRFISWLVVKTSYPTRTAGREVRFGRNWFHTSTSSTGQNWAAYMWTPCLRKQVNDLWLQKKGPQKIRTCNCKLCVKMHERDSIKSDLLWRLRISALLDLVASIIGSLWLLFRWLNKPCWCRSWVGFLQVNALFGGLYSQWGAVEPHWGLLTATESLSESLGSSFQSLLSVFLYPPLLLCRQLIRHDDELRRNKLQLVSDYDSDSDSVKTSSYLHTCDPRRPI